MSNLRELKEALIATRHGVLAAEAYLGKNEAAKWLKILFCPYEDNKELFVKVGARSHRL